jgi:hypothetical protein
MPNDIQEQAVEILNSFIESGDIQYRKIIVPDDGRARLIKGLDRRKVCKTVRDRVLRLNKTFPEGCIPKGWHRKPTYRNDWSRDVVGKGEFLRKFGRSTWERLLPGLIRKDGRREYVSQETIQDMPATLKAA